MTKKEKRELSEKKREKEEAKLVSKRNQKRTIIGVSLIVAALIVVIAVTVYDSRPLSEYAKLDFDKYVSVGDYTGFEYTQEETKVTDKDVQDTVQSDLKRFATEKAKPEDAVAENGDIARIDFTGIVDGKEVEECSGTDYSVELGSNSLIDGFEDSILGHKVKDEFTVDLEFPDDYPNAELAGKPVTFNINLVGLTQLEVPEYTDEFVTEKMNYKSKKEYEANICKRLQAQYDLAAESAANDEVWAQVLEKVEIKSYPDALLDEEFEMDKKQKETEFKQEYNASTDEMLEKLGVTYEDYNKEMRTYAKENVKNKLVAFYIADKENLDISKRAYRKYVNNMLEVSGIDEVQFEEIYGTPFEDYIKENDMYSQFVYNQAVEKVKQLGKKVDSKEATDKE